MTIQKTLENLRSIMWPTMEIANNHENNKRIQEEAKQRIEAFQEAEKALEKQNKIIKTTGISVEELIARNVIAWMTSKDSTQGMLPEIYLKDCVLFTELTGLEPTFPNLKKYMTY